MNVLGIFLLLIVGLFLSAFFSGSETGFYRATRTRLALDALGGDAVARGLMWLTNNPALFVATTLVGNNLANYLTSFAIVWGTSQLLTNHTDAVDLAISIVMSPLIFVYGELLPKNLFFAAPNKLLRLAGPFFLFCTVLFAPLAAILWSLGRLLESLLGVAPERLQLRLVRSELRRVISEGHEAGVLQPAQRLMADGMFQVATVHLDRFCVPMTQLAVARNSMTPDEMLRIARRLRSPVLFIQDQRRELMGYLNVIDLYLANGKARPRAKTMLRISRRESSIAALTQMQEQDQPHAALLGDNGRIMGIVDAATIAEAIVESNR